MCPLAHGHGERHRTRAGACGASTSDLDMRDAIFAAQALNREIDAILSPDRGFDGIRGLGAHRSGRRRGRGDAADEVRRPAVSRHLRRGRRAARRSARGRRRAAVARRARPEGRRCDRRARRLLLRRLSARRRDRALLAGHGVGDRLRERRRPGARDLQRLPGAVRGAPAARGAAAEREPALHLQAGELEVVETDTAFTCACGEAACDCGLAWVARSWRAFT